jgi:hypothetical protein
MVGLGHMYLEYFMFLTFIPFEIIFISIIAGGDVELRLLLHGSTFGSLRDKQ